QRRLKGDMLAAQPPLPPEEEGPVAVRRLKGDMLVARPRPTPEPDEKTEKEARPVVRLPPEPEAQPEAPAVPAARPPVTEKPPAVAPPNPPEASVWPRLEESKLAAKEPASPKSRTAKLFFNPADNPRAIERWAPGEEPVLVTPTPDPDMKRLALARSTDKVEPEAGQTIAGKGQVTGADQRPKSPAERLGLAGEARVKEEKCLSDAIYFEARGEPVRGQIAVAQVVLNRAFSG